MALTITSPLPSTYSVNVNEGNITLTIGVSSDQPSLSAITFRWSGPGITSTGKVIGTHPYYTRTLNIPAYSEAQIGIYSVTLLEYAVDGTPINSGSVSDDTNVTVHPTGYVPEALINGRTLDEHLRMYLLGYI
jgi:hypothetical protein